MEGKLLSTQTSVERIPEGRNRIKDFINSSLAQIWKILRALEVIFLTVIYLTKTEQEHCF